MLRKRRDTERLKDLAETEGVVRADRLRASKRQQTNCAAHRAVGRWRLPEKLIK